MRRFPVGIFILISLIFVAPASFAKAPKHQHKIRANSFMITWEEFQKLTTRNKVNYMMEMRNIMISAEVAEKAGGMKFASNSEIKSFLQIFDEASAAYTGASCQAAGWFLANGWKGGKCNVQSIPKGNCKGLSVPCNEMYFGNDHGDAFCVDASTDQNISDEKEQPVNNLVGSCMSASKHASVDMEAWYKKNVGEGKTFTKYQWKQNSAAINMFCADYINNVSKDKAWTTGACKRLQQLDIKHEALVYGADPEPTGVNAAATVTPAEPAPETNATPVAATNGCDGMAEVMNPLSGTEEFVSLDKDGKQMRTSVPAAESQFCQAHVVDNSNTSFPQGYYVVNVLKNKNVTNAVQKINIYRAKTPGGPYCLYNEVKDPNFKQVLNAGDTNGTCDTPEYAYKPEGVAGNPTWKIELDGNDTNQCRFANLKGKKLGVFTDKDKIKTKQFVFGHEDEPAYKERADFLKDMRHQLKCPNASTKSLAESLASLISCKDCFPNGIPRLRAVNTSDKKAKDKLSYDFDSFTNPNTGQTSDQHINVEGHLDATKPGTARLYTDRYHFIDLSWDNSPSGAKEVMRTAADWTSAGITVNGKGPIPMASVCAEVAKPDVVATTAKPEKQNKTEAAP